MRRSLRHRPPAGDGQTRRLVLIVEDDPDVQEAAAEHLTERGFEVVLASDGDTALQIVRERRPAIVYLDLNLPHISGYDVCEAVRTDPTLSDVAILMTSARGSIDVRAYSLEAGADAYLPKPYDLDELSDRIEELLAQRKASGGPGDGA
jgi:two-component system phosphate regulon response regulator PhoB